MVTIIEVVNGGLVDRSIKSAEEYAKQQKQEEQGMNDLDDKLKELLKKEGTGESVGGTKGEYTKVGNTYCNAPDLSGFNAACTYYITYDESGNEKIAGRVDKLSSTPDEWYDYGAKKWANVVTVNENDVAYWVWIPRYKYKIVDGKQEVDVKFVSTGNIYKQDNEEGEAQEVELTEDYKLPESFTFGGKTLAGFWISKYEVQVSKENGDEIVKIINENNQKKVTTTNPSGKYTIYANGIEIAKNATLPYNIQGLESLSNYDVMLVSETNGKILGSRKKRSIIEVDLSGFNPDCTYYVTYSDDGMTEKVGDKIQLDENGKATNMPNDWYDYENKEWANIVTINNGLTTYWTYIPRYEYKIYSSSQFVDIQFIPDTQTVADPGYIMPESFTFAEKPLKGFWISKYEIQEKAGDNEG